MRRRLAHAILLGFVCLNLLIRYPPVSHGVGVDSYLFSVLATAIANQGRAAWIVHPLSLFGFYPLSYPSGSFFLVADFSLTAGIHIEPAALLASQFVGVLGVFTAYVMAREISKNPRFTLTVALLFGLMPKFVTNTIWEVPARGLLMSFTPVFIWAVVRAIKSRRPVDLSIVAVSSMLMLLSHRLALIVFVVFFAFVVSRIFVVTAQIIRRRFPQTFLSPAFRRTSRVVSLPIYSGLVLLVLLGSGILESYGRGAISSSGDAFAQVTNLGGSISRSVGLLTPVAFLGVVVVARARNKSHAEYLLLTAPIALIPTLFLRDYTGYYLVTFFALFIGLGVAALLVRASGRLRHVLTGAFLVLAIVSAVAATTTELPRQSFMTNSEYTTGLYVRYQVPGTIASNDGLLAVRVASVTGGPCLPVGGATTPAYGPDALAFGFVRDFRVVSVYIWELTPDSDSMFVPVDVTVGTDWSVMMYSPLGDQSSTIADRYNVTSILENGARPAVYYTGWDVVYDSAFLRDIYESRYKIYEVGAVRIWSGP